MTVNTLPEPVEGPADPVRAPMIELHDVRWRYAATDVPALDGLSLSIAPGETVVLCGASGSGKSTALRLLNGLIPQFHEGTLEGTVRVAGLSVAETSLAELGRRTGTVLQHPRRQFFTGEVGTELAFACENLGVEPVEIRRAVARTAAEHGLTDLIERPLRALSGGEQQRTACAAAVTHGPELILFDEPTANLSADAIERFVAGIRRLRDVGSTVVIAEHRLQPLRDVVDRVVVLRDGRIDAVWTAAEFRRMDDSVLEAEGLRGHAGVARPVLPAVAGHGASVEPRSATAGPPDNRSGLTLEGIRCGYRKRPVLAIDQLHFPAGAVTAVRGRNGAGKTTLARVITGLQRHRGVVRLDGRPLSAARRQRNSALVMQDVQRQLFTDRVISELDFGGDPDRAEALLDDLDLLDVRDRHPLSLSGGQQQRLTVAAARLSGRAIVVFDEPSSGVDRRHLKSITRIIRELAEDGAVVVVISHDESLLAPAADHELVLVPLDPSETTNRDPWWREE